MNVNEQGTRALGAGRWELGVRDCVSGAGRRGTVSGTGCWGLRIKCWPLDVKHLVFGVGCLMLGFRNWVDGVVAIDT